MLYVSSDMLPMVYRPSDCLNNGGVFFFSFLLPPDQSVG